MHLSPDVLYQGTRETFIKKKKKKVYLLFHTFSLKVEVRTGRANFLNGDFGRAS